MVSRVTWNVKSDAGTPIFDGVSGSLLSLISVKPSRIAEDGSPMVWWALLGCISSWGGFIADEAGVEGAGAGEDGIALLLFLLLLFLGLGSGSR